MHRSVKKHPEEPILQASEGVQDLNSGQTCTIEHSVTRINVKRAHKLLEDSIIDNALLLGLYWQNPINDS